MCVCMRVSISIHMHFYNIYIYITLSIYISPHLRPLDSLSIFGTLYLSLGHLLTPFLCLSFCLSVLLCLFSDPAYASSRSLFVAYSVSIFLNLLLRLGLYASVFLSLFLLVLFS